MNFFQHFHTNESHETTHEQVIDLIRNDEELKASTMLHRELLTKGHADAATKVKESTPQVAVSFRMEGGKGKENCRECLYELLIDFDAKKPEERLQQEELDAHPITPSLVMKAFRDWAIMQLCHSNCQRASSSI